MSDYEYYTMLYNQWKIWKEREQKVADERRKIEKELFEKCDTATLVRIMKEMENAKRV